MKTSLKLVFFGTEDFSAASLRALLSAGYGVTAVVSKPDSKSGRGQKQRSPKVAELAKQAGIKLLQPDKISDIKDELASSGANYGVLSAYGKIIPQNIIDLFHGGIINIHPSLLPKYRGPSPIETFILDGGTQTGVSLMKLSAGMDEGPVYAQRAVDVTVGLDAFLLTEHLAETGAELLMDKLPSILSGRLDPTPQDDRHATYTKLLRKQDGIIDWREPAEVIERKVRAYKVWPKSRAKVFGQDIVITGVRVAEAADDGILVIKCAPGYLEIQQLVAPSGRTINGADFIRGYKRD